VNSSGIFRSAAAKATRVLGWKPRSGEEVATAEILVKFGIVGSAAR
jgi:hypothetical protein